MNKETFCNLLSLLSEYEVKIPVIQRDYVHGRENPRVKRILEKFLNDIENHLKDGKKLHLDFIYGKVTENKEFIPIDGQQRLTLLFLLHLYLGTKNKKDISFLERFSYEVRASSKEFCKKLVDKFKLDPAQDSISTYLKDQSWFIPQWEKDPTVSSMLAVLNKIHEKFKDSEIKFEDLDRITFDLFELEKFNLDEKLYIQMNSRGRQLTEFELFKSKFIEFLEEEENFKEELETIKQKIDGKWTDFFWNHYKLKEKIDGKEYSSIDKPFLNFIYFITEMLGYETLEAKKADKNTEIDAFYNKEEIEELGFDKLFKLIYQKENNVKFLIEVLERLEDIKDNNENIWGVFSRSEIDYEQNKGKVAVVSKENEKDLLKRVVLKKDEKEAQDKGRELNLMEKILLFLLIKCIIKELNVEKFKDLLRVARNLLIRIRTPGSDGVSYNLTLGRKDLHRILKLFDEWIGKDIYSYLEKVDPKGTGISKASLNHEKEKAQIITNNPALKEYIHKIEDHIYVRGDLMLWEGIDFKTVAERLYKTFEREDEKIIPILIIARHELENKNKDAGENENNKCPYPCCIAYNKVFFGRENYWEVLLTEKELKDLWKLFLTESKYSPENWERCRDEFRNQFSNNKKTWYYYFVKYPDIFERFKGTLHKFEQNDKNVFLLPSEFNCFNSPEDLAAWLCAEKMRTNEANGYHLNPFIYYVCKKSELLKHYVNENDGVHYGCGIGDDFASYIVIKGEKFRIKGCDGNTPLDKQKDLVEELKEKLEEKINAKS